MIEDIKIIYEDDYLLAIDKPAGLVVNRSNTYKSETVQDWIDKNYSLQSKFLGIENEEFRNRSGLAHRLDKDTSGVLLIAKDPGTLSSLLKQFKSRETEKQYVALVHGKIAEPILEINAPIGRNPNRFMKFAVVSGGKPAFTRVEKLKELKIDDLTYTLVNVFPKTGRTHQIRVHLGALGNYIAGDVLYCANNLLEHDAEAFNRMMLFAKKIEIVHPVSGEMTQIEAKTPVEFSL